MIIDYIGNYFNLTNLKEEFRKIGVNFVSAGFVGVFINHFVGYKFSAMIWTSASLTLLGTTFLLMGLFKRGNKL